MARKKSSHKKSTQTSKAPKAKKKAPAKKFAQKKTVKKLGRKAVVKNKPAKLKPASSKKRATKTASFKKRPLERRVRGKADIVDGAEIRARGLGPNSGGQSGDLQGISNSSEADSESVAELLEEGQSYEAEVVQGVESAPDADRGPVRTHEVPEDDVPEEYRQRDLPG